MCPDNKILISVKKQLQKRLQLPFTTNKRWEHQVQILTVPLYQRSHFLISDRRNKWLPLVLLNISRHMLTFRFAQYHKHLLYISESVALLTLLLTLNFSSSDASLPSASHSLTTLLFSLALSWSSFSFSLILPPSLSSHDQVQSAGHVQPTYCFLSLLWIHPDASVYTLPHIYKKSPSQLCLEWSCCQFTHSAELHSHMYSQTFFFNF